MVRKPSRFPLHFYVISRRHTRCQTPRHLTTKLQFIILFSVCLINLMKPPKKGHLREEDDSGFDVQRSIVRERPIDVADVILWLLKANDLKV